MSETNGAVDTSSCCASCGIAEVDEVKLKECADCDLVRYCSDECLKDHKPQHKKDCKKRAAELRDELLFKQPESSHLGDCPICFIPMPLDVQKSIMQACCSKVICKGCDHANQIREAEASLQHKCPFCREPIPDKDEIDKWIMKRIEANDPLSMHQEGIRQFDKGDYSNAFRYYTKAAELGDVEAQFQLARLYNYGHGVEKERGKEIYHLEEAAIGGHPSARYNLAWHEYHNGNIKRAVKHWIISATQGLDHSIKALMNAFKRGLISKEEITATTLRAHQAAVDATKSPQREAADEYYRKLDNMHSC